MERNVNNSHGGYNLTCGGCVTGVGSVQCCHLMQQPEGWGSVSKWLVPNLVFISSVVLNGGRLSTLINTSGEVTKKSSQKANLNSLVTWLKLERRLAFDHHGRGRVVIIVLFDFYIRLGMKRQPGHTRQAIVI